MRQFITIFLILCLGFSSQAQTELDFDAYQKKYPKTQLVVLQEIEELHVTIQQGELKVYETYVSKRQYLTKDASMFRERQLGFSSFSAYHDIEALTFVPNNGKFKKQKTKVFTESDDLESSVFHDDSKIIGFNFLGLQLGAQTELRYTREIKDPHFIGRAMLQDGYPVEHQVYRVVVDKGIEMAFTQYHADQDFITFSKKEEKGKVIYEWIVKDAPVIKSEKWSPNITYYTPQILPRIASYPLNGETKYVLRDVNDLFSWYEGFVDTLNSNKNDPLIQAIVDSIVTGSDNELEKVQRVFEWTQENIKYVAYESGLGGFVPRPAHKVCSDRYGDCKDMASTITQLLNYAGIESHLTWIGTNSIPFTYEELPTPSVDNHMIATYIDDQDQYYFMDATGRYMPFGLPSSFIQEQESLIRLSNGKFETKKVPMVSPVQNALYDSVSASIVDGVFTGEALSTFDGYYKQNLEYKLEDLTEDEKSKFLKAYLRKGSNKFIPSNFKESHAYPDKEAYAITYNFTIADYAMTNVNELYINLNLNNGFNGDKIKKDRTTPFQFKFVSLSTSIVELAIPEGYELDYVPPGLDLDNELMYYHSSYEVKSNKIISTTVSHKKKLTYPITDVTLWNKSINTIIKSQKNVIILKKSN